MKKIVSIMLIVCLCLLYSSSAQAIVLRKGSNGQDVKNVQQKLHDLGYYWGAIDGIYGSQTETSVRYFQKAYGLTVDGVVGPQTLNALGLQPSSGTTPSSSDVYLLARVIYGEARGEPYVGKVAIGAVILNRVKSPLFPNTIAGVIYQPGAFTVVSDGQINLTPDADCIKAARDSMAGWDPTNGCLFYYNPRTATSQWMLSKPISVTIGNHVFCR